MGRRSVKTVRLRNLEVGAGAPKVIVPIVGRTREDILAQAARAAELAPDAVEWRADFYEEVSDLPKALEALRALRGVLGEVPLLFTFRTRREGGERDISPEDYAALNIAAARSGEADGVDGTITAITLSYTAFTTPDNKEIFVPNSQLAAVKIINYNALGKRRLDLKFSASYDASTQRVRDAILEAVSALPQILDDPAPAVYLSEYQASSIQYLLRLWTQSEDYWEVYFALLEGVRESFIRWEVEMTYDHLNVHIVEPRS